MTVMSGLGEPLNAEIEIAANKEELSSLSARIAPSETYAEQGVERASSLSNVRVELGRKPDGTPILKISSQQPVNDPFLDMLIQVDWSTGRLLREYTALLDPPGYGDRSTSGSEAAESPKLPAVAIPSKKNTTKSAPALAGTSKPASSAAPADTYVTKRGDTLRNVARNMQVDDVTLEQMLVGLYRNNREAFMGDNMNQLKVGQIMRAPREEELRAIKQQEALQEVRVHTSNWNAYRNDVAQAIAQSKPAPADEQPQTSGGKITAQAEDKAAPPVAGPRDVVKLSRSEAGGNKAGPAGSGNASVSEDKMRALEEESTAQEKAIGEVNERIAFFEKQIQDMQKLLLVQNQMLAELQKGQPVDQPPGAEPTPAPEQPQAQPPAEQPAAQPAKPAPTLATPVTEAPAETNLLDELLQDPMKLGAAGGVLALLVGGWLLLRRQRRKNLDNFEKGILTSSGLKTDTVFGTTAGAAVDTGETSFMSDFSHRNGAGMIDTSDVDPISEAEVYMAYGRDAQAEEILKDAINKEPKRYELHLKLLEIYAKRKDAAAFETLAGELYATLGTTDPIWRKVAEMGRGLEPENPMYAATGESASASASSSAPSAAIQAAAGAAVAAAAYEMTSDVAVEESAPEAVQDNSLDFDLGMLAADEESTAGIEKDDEGAESIEPLPDLDTFSAPATELEDTQDLAEDLSDTGMEFELPEPAAEGNVQLSAADLSLPEIEPATEAVEEVEEISFDLPALDMGDTSELSEESMPALEKAEEEKQGDDLSLPALTPVDTPEGMVEEISFDLPELTLPGTESPSEEETFPLPEAVESPVTAAESASIPELEMPEVLEEPIELKADPVESPSFDLPEIAEPVEPIEPESVAEPEPVVESVSSKMVVDEIVFEEPPKEEESALDFNFDLDVEPEASTEEAPAQAASIPDLDLSGISLDIGEQSSSAAEPAAEEITLSGTESSDVDTKLDLVTAYMDMGDTEGARELLEEVLQEGGPQQRERAQKLLDSLA
ncbi:MAG TPA: FimV/HubP family polar landmark protein [Methylophilaceae bacterium]|nr:FimV/HubP family polar landmark protein [Methylophilaceae bacterium]